MMRAHSPCPSAPDRARDADDFGRRAERMPDGPVTRLFRQHAVDGLGPRRAGETSRAAEFAMRSRSVRTMQKDEALYRIAARAAEAIGREAPLPPVSPQYVAEILSHLADDGYSYGTILNMKSLFATMHRFAGLANPCGSERVRATLAGIARTLTTASPHAKAALSAENLRDMVVEARRHEHPLRAHLDSTLLLLTFASGTRRREAAGLLRSDVAIARDGMQIFISNSKTNQAGTDSVWVERSNSEFCPVAAVERWIEAAHVVKGPLLRRVDRSGRALPRPLSGRYIARAVQHYGAAVGMDPTLLGAHSLRSGLITAVLDARVMSEERLMAHTRQVSVDTLLRYYRPQNRRSENLTKGVGL